MDLDSYQPQVVPQAHDQLQIHTGPLNGQLHELEDLGPQPRDRCNTWPLQRPSGDLSQNTSPLIHEEIPEESSLHGSQDSVTFTHRGPSPDSSQAASPGALHPDDPADPLAGAKKNSARRNAWGNMSYADLITQAILNSPDKRLTLSQIYDWMVQNVPYFRDKGDSNSSAGWKNSIRHNLSLHSRFMRIQNEGAGKSSWWVINPDAKPGKASRRRAQTMDTKPMEKKRRGVRNKVEKLRQAALANADLSPVDSSSDAFSSHGFSSGEFRARSNSNLSNYSVGTGRLSPQLEDLFDEASWAGPARQSELNDLLDMASMRLENGVGFDAKPPPPPYPQHPPSARLPFPPTSVGQSPGKLESDSLSPAFRNSPIKQEPPAYQTLYPTTYGKMSNPALCAALKSGQNGHGFYGTEGGGHEHFYPAPSAGHPTNGPLPLDIQDVRYDRNLQCDISAVLQHELNVAGNLDFKDFNMDTYGNC